MYCMANKNAIKCQFNNLFFFSGKFEEHWYLGKSNFFLSASYNLSILPTAIRARAE